MRRLPRQARGRERVERILAAAAEEFVSQGFDGTTMTAIAARADTSIGSVYQFFRDKPAILDALVDRYRVDLADIGSDLLPGDGGERGQDLVEALDPVVDRLVGYCRDNPAFPALLALAAARSVERSGESVHRALRDVVARILAVKHRDPVLVDRTAIVLTDIVAGVLPLAVADDAMVAHLKAAMVGYLERIAGPDAAS